LTGIIDENGDRYATYAYDEQGRAVSSEHTGGDGKITIVYDEAGNTRTVTNALGKRAVYHLEPFQSLLKVTRIEGQPSEHCAAADSSFEYDDNSYIRKVTDGEGNVTTYTRDALGQELARTEGEGTAEERTFTTEWHETFRLPVSITEPARRVTFVYDDRGRLSQSTETDLTTHTVPYPTFGQARSWTYAYTAEGLRDAADGPLPGPADKVDYEYDSAGNLKRVTNAVGHVTTILEVDGAGRPLSVQAPNAIVTNLSYDLRGRLAGVTKAAGVPGEEAVTRFAYDAAGNLRSITQPDGSRLVYEYDAAHRLTAVRTGDGERIGYELNDLGQLTKVEIRDADGLLTTTMAHTYDELGRLLKDLGAGQQTTLYSYDRADRRTGRTDPLGRVYGSAYDALGRVIRETDPDRFETLLSYDANDALVGVTDALTHQTAYVTNGFGEVIRRVSPDSGTTDFWCDQAGRRVRQVDARGVETLYTYDALDRITSITFPASPSENRTLTYDEPAVLHGTGFLTGVTDQAGHMDFAYDARGNLIRDSRTLGATGYETRYSYDPADRFSSITYPSGRIVSYLRDSQGRIVTVTTRRDPDAPETSVATGITYLPFGPVAQLTLGNGLESRRDHDLDGRVRHIRLTGPGRTLLDRELTYDAAGDITAVSDHVDPARSETFGYDALDRLAVAAGPYGTIGYTYDASGNRTSRTLDRGIGVETELLTLDPTSNRLLSVSTGAPGGNELFADGFESGDLACWSVAVGGMSGAGACPPPPVEQPWSRTFTYSANGSVRSTVETGRPSFTFLYNHANRLSGVERDGEPLASYTYDTYERRVVKALAGGGTVHYHYAPDGRLLAETESDGATIREILWLEDLPLAFVLPAPAGGQEIIFLQTDQLGRPVLATDGEGSPVWEGTFEPFGKLYQETGNLRQDLRFPGQLADAETGLFYNWHRYYDPETGRYGRPDPLGLSAGVIRAELNAYLYARGNSIRFSDPAGLLSKQDVRRAMPRLKHGERMGRYALDGSVDEIVPSESCDPLDRLAHAAGSGAASGAAAGGAIGCILGIGVGGVGCLPVAGVGALAGGSRGFVAGMVEEVANIWLIEPHLLPWLAESAIPWMNDNDFPGSDTLAPLLEDYTKSRKCQKKCE
jgi:RHS repeat-associated protein